MATYKLIQDIEAEDKLIWLFSLRQFIFAVIAVLFFYLSFIVIAKGASFLAVVFLPPALFCGFFAIPFGRDQSTEVWALAKIRFYLKPRRRIWDQSGARELVTITVPKREEKHLTDGLEQDEVHSRLKALANTIDSRGWAVKDANVSMYPQANPYMQEDTDRLVDINNLPQEVPTSDVRAADDILDATSNPIAQQFEQMIKKSEETHRQQVVEQMTQQAAAQTAAAAQPAQAPTPADYWFLNQPTAVVSKAKVIDESAATEQLKTKHGEDMALYSHMRTLRPVNEKSEASQPEPVQSSPPSTDPAIISLASNNDLNVATIAREASRAMPHDEEVVVSLH